VLANELRNPLAPIRNAAELLTRMVPVDSKLQAPVAILMRQSALLTRLVDDLLDLSRITRGRLELKLIDVDLRAVIAHALETVQPLMDEKRHKVRLSAISQPLLVHADFARLAQCLVNVLTNAAKYTDAEGEIRISMRADGKTGVVDISDNGAGISAELLPNVFDLFVQGGRTLDQSKGGLGIGLSLVKHLVQMHGGRISVQSDGVDRGTTFEICLPLATPMLSAAPDTTAA
jgi:signal transduction histidine kinase